MSRRARSRRDKRAPSLILTIHSPATERGCRFWSHQ